MDIKDGSYDLHGPAFQRHDLEQREHGISVRAEPEREFGTEEIGRNDSVHIKDQQEEHTDSGDPRYSVQQGTDHSGNRGDQSQRPE